VAGSARSGTTWLAEVLARTLQARTLFEPFIVDSRGRAASLQPGPWSEAATRRSVSRYLPEVPSGDPWEASVERILRGSVRLLWRDHTPPGLYRRRVVKGVRANLLLGHVTARWPDLAVVWLVRDPVEVVASQLKMRERGWDFDWQPECVLAQQPLMNDWLSPFEDVIRGAEELVDRLAVRWCVENYVPRHQDRVAERALRLAYADLCSGIEPWRILSRRLVERGLARPGDADERGVLRGLWDDVTGPQGRRGGSGDELPARDRDRVTRLVERFGLLDVAGTAPADQ